MSTRQHFELAILGAGCAGLSLARELAHAQVSRSVLIIEPREAYQDDRSWCFWATEEDPYADWASQGWTRWLFGCDGQSTQARDCPGYQYHYTRSSDFYRDSLNVIGTWPSIDLKLGESVIDLSALGSGWQVTTSAQTYHADQVIDTRPPAQHRCDESTLKQCFLGAEIRLKQPANIDLAAVELMTDMRTVKGEFCFTYILPFTANHLLVEVTYFTAQPPTAATLQNQLNQLLAERGWADAEVLRTESAQLPMGLPPATSNNDKQPLLAGMRGGALRPSSGYGFLRIQHWAANCAKAYSEKGTLLPQTTSGFWLSKMDHLFLSVLRKDPTLAPKIFKQMLSRTDPARFIRFMNDRASWSDCLQIVACLPKTPFLKAFVRELPTLLSR